MRHLLRLLLGLLPASRLKNALLSRTGRSWSVAPDAAVQPTVLWRIGSLRVASGARIGFGNTIRDMHVVELDERALVGQFNWISGASAWLAPDLATAASLRLGREACILSRHYLDCGGGVEFAPMARLAGVRSTLMTHAWDAMEWEPNVAPIRLGERDLVSSHTFVSPGVTVADCVVVGAGSVIIKDLDQPETLYAGSPAVAKRSLAGARMFTLDSLERRAHERGADGR